MLVNTSINDEVIRLIIEGYVIPTPGKFRSKIGPLDARVNVLEFGDIFPNTIENESISISNSTEDTIYIKQINEFEHIKLKIEPHILEPEQSGEIAIQLSILDSKLGKLISVCNFEIIKKGKKINGYLSISANIVEDFSLLTDWELANPPIMYTDFQKIELGKIELNKLMTKEIEIENRGKRDLLVHNITTTNSSYSINPAKLTIISGKKGVFQINIKPTTDRNNIASKLTIISNDPDKSVINFSITGEVVLTEGNDIMDLISEISVEKAESIIQNFKGQDEFVILDIRTKDEYNNGCIEDAVNFDYYNPDFNMMLELMNKHKTYLVYCRSGVRSKDAVDIMSEMGFKKIYHMHEGLEGWTAQRLKLTDPNK
jgi:rhodanese-related sulfurtransferase